MHILTNALKIVLISVYYTAISEMNDNYLICLTHWVLNQILYGLINTLIEKQIFHKWFDDYTSFKIKINF